MGVMFSVLGMAASGLGVAANYADQDSIFMMVFAALFGVNFCTLIVNLSNE